MASKPEQDIEQLESLLRRLEKEYDQFLLGQLRKEPSEMEGKVLALVRAYATRPIQNSTLAFKYTSLVARYNSFKTQWSRRLREKEEGRGSVVPALARVAPPPPPKGHAPTLGAGNPAEYLSADPRREERRLQSFFEIYRKKRQAAGEPVDKLRPEQFQKALADKIEKIKAEQGCDAVLVRLVADGGKVRLVAKPFRRGPGKAGQGPEQESGP